MLAILVARSIDSLKLCKLLKSVVARLSQDEVVTSRTTFRTAVVFVRLVAVQSRVPLMLKVGGTMAIMGQ